MVMRLGAISVEVLLHCTAQQKKYRTEWYRYLYSSCFVLHFLPNADKHCSMVTQLTQNSMLSETQRWRQPSKKLKKEVLLIFFFVQVLHVVLVHTFVHCTLILFQIRGLPDTLCILNRQYFQKSCQPYTLCTSFFTYDSTHQPILILIYNSGAPSGSSYLRSYAS